MQTAIILEKDDSFESLVVLKFVQTAIILEKDDIFEGLVVLKFMFLV
jgi:hypothetical protein